MSYLIVGLGNPGEEYEKSRHNVGREFVVYLTEKNKLAEFSEWKENKKTGTLETKGFFAGKSIKAILPDIYMNRSGTSVRNYIKSAKEAEKMIVFHDDLDLPVGSFKISFGKGSGGHKGIESVQKVVKTKNYIRFRIGISPETPSGKLRKPKGDKDVVNFVLKKFSIKEEDLLKKIKPKVASALETILCEGLPKAMSVYN